MKKLLLAVSLLVVGLASAAHANSSLVNDKYIGECHVETDHELNIGEHVLGIFHDATADSRLKAWVPDGAFWLNQRVYHGWPRVTLTALVRCVPGSSLSDFSALDQHGATGTDFNKRGDTFLSFEYKGTSYKYSFSRDGKFSFTSSIIEAARQSTQTYITNRAKAIVAGSPDMIERLRGGPQGAQGNPLGFAAVGNDENLHMSFNTSLRGMVAQRENARRKAAQAEIADARIDKAFNLNGSYVLAYGPEAAKIDPTPADAAQSGQSYAGFDAWASGTYAHVNSGSSKSDIGLVHSGVDYRFSDQLLVGVLAQLDYDKSKDGALKASGWGYMVGPYIATKLAGNLYFDSSATFGQSFNDINTSGTTGKFNTDRFMLTAKLSGDVDLGSNVTLTPFVKGVYFWEKQKSYTDSLSNVIPEHEINLASVEVGPKLSKSFKQNNGTLVNTSISFSSIYASEAGKQSIRAKLSSSLGMSFVNGVSVDFLAFYDGLGDNDYEAYGASAKMRVPF